jgi:peptidyl-tRNA hydrolase
LTDTVSGLTAVAFRPMAYEDFPRALKNCQVSGLDRPREVAAEIRTFSPGPHVVVDADLKMSTGKTAAQVAHGLYMYAMSLGFSDRSLWSTTNCSMTLLEIDSDEFDSFPARITVVDAGLTELTPGSVTVKVL